MKVFGPVRAGGVKMAQVKRKKAGRWIVLAIVLVLVFLSLSGNTALLRVRRETRSLKAQIQKLNYLADSLSNEISKLKSDTAYIEKTAREKLGMAKKGETVYKFAAED
jgi:cell division protein FtsB